MDNSEKKPSAFRAWLVAILVVVMFTRMITDGALEAAFGFTGAILLVTGIWQLAKGSSWLVGLNPAQPETLGRSALAIGGMSLAISFVLPAPTISAEPAPAASAPAPAPEVTVTVTATVTTAPSPSPSMSPSGAPSPPAFVTSALSSATPTSVDSTEGPETVAAALAVLEDVPVKGRAPKTGYDRALFGQRWADVDRNGCDTRNDTLNRDLQQVTYKPGTRDCVVLTGVLDDPYTGTVIDFVRGEVTSNEVQIDHVVALADAWQKGAQQLDLDTRTAFANDPLNLLAVDGPTNLQKGDGDAATWLPPNKGYRCEYVARQTQVKAKYGLWMTQAESDAIRRVLQDCPGQTAPASESSTTAHQTPTSTPTPTAAAKPVEQPRITAAPSTSRETEDTVPAPVVDLAPDAYYKNCTAARAAGAAPLYVGEPGYRKALDRDGDGVACE